MGDPAGRGGRLAENIVQFARILRSAGLPVGPASVLDGVRAVEAAGLEARVDIQAALRSVFVTRREQIALFDQAFALYWRSRGLAAGLGDLISPVERPAAAPAQTAAGALRLGQAMAPDRAAAPRSPESRIEIDARMTQSDREILHRKDFAQMSVEELAAARQAMARLVLPLDRVASRRMRSSPQGHRIDLRRTLSATVRAGGESGRLEMLAPRLVQPPLVALIDISGSMSQYSRILLHFMHAMAARRRHVSTFLFGTRLTNVTRALVARDPDEALAQCAALVPDWSGGTRIGSALATFNRLWSRRILAGGPTVLLVTDGLERDPGADLARETERLAKSCRRLIWLNPLLRFDGFEPRAQGIRLMLPEVDDFRPVHNLAAIADFCCALGEMQP